MPRRSIAKETKDCKDLKDLNDLKDEKDKKASTSALLWLLCCPLGRLGPLGPLSLPARYRIPHHGPRQRLRSRSDRPRADPPGILGLLRQRRRGRGDVAREPRGVRAPVHRLSGDGGRLPPRHGDLGARPSGG